MSDLIERLRAGARAVEAAGLPLETSIYKAAADEIERLRLRLEDATETLKADRMRHGKEPYEAVTVGVRNALENHQ